MEHDVVVNLFTRALLELAEKPEHETVTLNQTLRLFFHEARNRLCTLKWGLYLARRSGTAGTSGLWEELEARYGKVEQLVEHVQLLCRPAPFEPCVSSLGQWIRERSPTWADWFARNDRPFEANLPQEDHTGVFDPSLLLRGIDALVSWRAAAGSPGNPARLSLASEGGEFLIDWHEPRVAPAEARTAQDWDVNSLALPLLSRVMKSHGGVLRLTNDDGLRVGLRWPVRAEV